MSLKGVGAVVTGGASGIGLGVCRALVAAGANVIVADFQDELGIAFAAGSPQLTSVHCDVTKTEDLEALTVAAAQLPGGGGATIWFLNAGISEVSDCLTAPDDKRWKKIMDIDITAVIEGASLAFRHIVEHAGVTGRDVKKFIISTASMAGLLPQNGVVYAAAKAAVVQFGRSLATRPDVNHHNVMAYTLCPSFTEALASGARASGKAFKLRSVVCCRWKTWSKV